MSAIARRASVVLAVSSLVVGFLPHPSFAAESGEFFFPCGLSHRAMDDPIVFPGDPGAAHMHAFIGNTSTDAYSTATSLSKSRTTCRMKKDKSAYWVPELIVNGRRQKPVKIQLYYRNGVSASPRPFPFGLKVVQGNPDARSRQAGWSTREFWMCNGGGRHYSTPPNCGEELVMQVIFPQCWDGQHLDSPDHRSHMAYPRGGECPNSHGVVVPRLQLQVKFDIHHAARARTRLSSGSIYGVHADFFNAWDSTTLRRLIHDCLDRGTSCHL